MLGQYSGMLKHYFAVLDPKEIEDLVADTLDPNQRGSANPKHLLRISIRLLQDSKSLDLFLVNLLSITLGILCHRVELLFISVPGSPTLFESAVMACRRQVCLGRGEDDCEVVRTTLLIVEYVNSTHSADTKL